MKLTCKNIQSKTKKQIKYFELRQKKSNFVSSRKRPHVLSDYKLPGDNSLKVQVDQGLQPVQVDIDIFTHIQEYSRTIQAYSVIFNTLNNSGIFKTRDIFRTLAYSEPWYIQKPGIFRTRGILGTLSNIYDGVFCKNS